jgi:GNAT superfamily N-acetyltransferase
MAESSTIHHLSSAELLANSTLFSGVQEVFSDPFGMDQALLRTLAEHVATDFFVHADPSAGSIASAAAVSHTPGKAMEIVFLATRPGYLRQGKARELIRTIEDVAQTAGTTALRASVEGHRRGMQRLLGTEGYKPSTRGLGGEFQKNL